MPLSDFQRTAQSLTGWWELGGVDWLCADAPASWLDAEKRADAEKQPDVQLHRSAAAEPSVSAPPVSAQGSMAAPAPLASSAGWPRPQSYDELLALLSGGASLPGAGYAPVRVLPAGDRAAPLMIVTDCPDEEDVNAGALFSGPSGALLDAMLRAMGTSRDQCYIAPLAVSRPVAGIVPDADHGALAELMRLHIAFTGARRLLLFGNSVAQALHGRTIHEARGRLQDINHQGGIMAGAATYHPRTMLARPALKAACWQDLQLLMKDMN